MARNDDHHRRLKVFLFGLIFWTEAILEISSTSSSSSDDSSPFTSASSTSTVKKSLENLTACQHMRRTELRRAKSFGNNTNLKRFRIPRCTKQGEFEKIQCVNESSGTDCWCVDIYGVEIPGTRNESRSRVSCYEPPNCPESNCRMFCPAGFSRDLKTGCYICKCRDPCEGVECPRGLVCQQQQVKCKTEPCPPVPTCKKARSLTNWCPAGSPLSITGSVRPFLCGVDPGKPQCPPLYECLVELGNDYGVCCPNSLNYKKPGMCPLPEDAPYTTETGFICGTPCSHDLECPYMEKCCFSKGCKMNCQQPSNITTCHQARALSEILAVSEREGRGYVPDCSGPGGTFSSKQCSRNGLVCWCVDSSTGHKIRGSMGAANSVDCDGFENMIARSFGRSVNMDKCDINICAAVCEYGFKNDHNGCPSCECSEPCEGFSCPSGSHCEVAVDQNCSSGSSLCASWPVCKPDIVYSNPCEVGTPLADNITGGIFYCHEVEGRRSREFQESSFFDDEDAKEDMSKSNKIVCPSSHICTQLHGNSKKVCCPKIETQESEKIEVKEEEEPRRQTMCEYLRDFPERMEGTEEGMQLAIPTPSCTKDGSYESRQCSMKNIKLTKAEQRKVLEENTIRQMRKLLHQREKRETPNLKLYRVDEKSLNIHVAAPTMARSAKVIDVAPMRHQGLLELFEPDFKKVSSAANRKKDDDLELVEMDVEECWCVDGFGTEIPDSRGFNVTLDECNKLRESIECLDLTCRMGCEYGFVLDPETKCPACDCRDPCDNAECGEGKECRTVDVACDDEYCPPVPACLPRKAGQCPFLVPPGSDNSKVNSCDYECRTDAHCEGTKRCCSNGCGTQCVEPELKTACQHLQTIQLHQASELGVPPKQMYIVQCDPVTGKWTDVQCGPDNMCWCVDEQGQEIGGTRVKGKTPMCKSKTENVQCPMIKCLPCEFGYKVDSNGCRTCECRSPCDEISCSIDEECQLINVDCVDSPCPRMPICVPRRESLCPEGNPLRQGDSVVTCGPYNGNEVCPTTHMCQLNPVINRGICCAKTRDVCFESIDNNCFANSYSQVNSTRWRFNPRANKCVPITISMDDVPCQSKNLFHNELACNSVCPTLTQCERLKLKNSLAAKRSIGDTSIWFQPKCDPITGHWGPVQCLGKQPLINNKPRGSLNNNLGRAFSQTSDFGPEEKYQHGICWCADRKGAPLKGTLTRDLEPICNHRQARRRMHQEDNINDPLMEELIRQMTVLGDDYEENTLSNVNLAPTTDYPDLRGDEQIQVTERIFDIINSPLSASGRSIDEITPNVRSTKELIKITTRCKALSETASFKVACDENGSFSPTQCNGNVCWCVDAAGNQLPATDTFIKDTKQCLFTPIGYVAIELHLKRDAFRRHKSLINLYDILKSELIHLLGNSVENLRVQENLINDDVLVKFELHDDKKIDTAFAIEEMVRQNKLILGNGQYKPDVTLSRFMHKSQHQDEQIKLPKSEAASIISVSSSTSSSTTSSSSSPSTAENTLEIVVFILATSSAFLVSIFVVFIMLKRGSKKKIMTMYPDNRVIGGNPCSGDKYVDYSSPIFVLSPCEKTTMETERKVEIPTSSPPESHSPVV